MNKTDVLSFYQRILRNGRVSVVVAVVVLLAYFSFLSFMINRSVFFAIVVFLGFALTALGILFSNLVYKPYVVNKSVLEIQLQETCWEFVTMKVDFFGISINSSKSEKWPVSEIRVSEFKYPLRTGSNKKLCFRLRKQGSIGEYYLIKDFLTEDELELVQSLSK